MIQSLRQWHRRVFTGLAVLLPVVTLVAVSARKSVPEVPAFPMALETASPLTSETEWVRDDLFGRYTIQVRLLKDVMNAGRFAIAFMGPADFAKPDLLVYWIAGSPGNPTTAPDGARLLGGFSAGALSVPEEALAGEGSLILFSPTDQKVVDISKPLRLTKKTR